MNFLRIFGVALILFSPLAEFGQTLLTPFEISGGKATASFQECIQFYKGLLGKSKKISIRTRGMSDAGYPYDVVLYSSDGKFDPKEWHRQHKIIILVINGIHPGEPDGVDASMLLFRDIVTEKKKIPDNVALAYIPIYNIGGALNRNSMSRVNQDGPAEYGFRGNAQNLDLNRDFTKCDSRDARSFVDLFHWLNPDIQLDNHVSDGADYQHTMTLISTQWNKLGGQLGSFLHDRFDPLLYASMERKGWTMCPYVNFETGNPYQGWDAFYDPPRYSSGYAALFHTLSYISETHMLKPFKQRVESTYALMISLIEVAAANSLEILEKRKQDIAGDQQKRQMPLSWRVDSTRQDAIMFKGYTADYKKSEVTGKQRLYYDHTRPFEKEVPYYDYFKEEKYIDVPKAYIIPQGWHKVIELLQLNGIKIESLTHDTIMEVQVSRIENYRSASRAYESHHKNSSVSTSISAQKIKFLKGDKIIYSNQPGRRFLLEMLEPTGDDSYFSWNFFDAILQQKEGYSDYRWEDVAAGYLNTHQELRTRLEEKKKSDTAFAANASAQLDYVYRNSPYYEPAHLRYPAYRLL